MAKRIIVSVSNDMSTDQRVDKTCRSLLAAGYQVQVLCRQLPGSLPLDRPYPVKRMKLLFNKGPLFYAALNLRLFWNLLWTSADIFLANDLDTLLANYLARGIRGRSKTLVYDSHEYFTEVPELEGRYAKKVWQRIEAWIFPKLQHAYTVNRSIADIYHEKYKVPVGVIHNLSDKRNIPSVLKTRDQLGLPEDAFIMILQGAGINVDRGAEEALLSLKELPDRFQLLFIGGGDVYDSLKLLARDEGLEGRVMFRPRMPWADLIQYTAACDLGLSLDKKWSGNYDLALPNKIFDCWSVGVPLIIGPTKEASRIITEFNAGLILDEVDPSLLAQAVLELEGDEERLKQLSANAHLASETMNWVREEKELHRIFAAIG